MITVNKIERKINIANISPLENKESVSISLLNTVPSKKLNLPCGNILQLKGIAFSSNGSFDPVEERFSNLFEKFHKIKKEGKFSKNALKRFLAKRASLQDQYPIERRACRAEGKLYQGKAIFDDVYTDFDKVGWDKLQKDSPTYGDIENVTPVIDWATASKKDIFAFNYSNFVAEAIATPWVKIFNYENVNQPLSTKHTLNSDESVRRYAKALEGLQNDDTEFVEKARQTFYKKIQSDMPVKNVQSNALDAVSEVKESDPDFLDKPILDANGNINTDFIVFDTETTGLNIEHENNPKYRSDQDPARILQIGAAKLEKGRKVTALLEQNINPILPIDKAASRVHGITDKMVEDKPTMEQLLTNDYEDEIKPDAENRELLEGGFMKYLGDTPIVAYNANFDIPLLNSEIREVNQDKGKDFIPEVKYSNVIDPFIIMQRIHPFVGARKRLVDQHRAFFGQDVPGAHNAMVDVKATVNVLKYCLYYLNKHYDPKKNENQALKYRDVLKFQFGEQIPGLDIKLDPNTGFDKSKSFKESYRVFCIGVKNFPAPFKFKPKKKNDQMIALFVNEIGIDNTIKILESMPKAGIKYKREKNLRLYLSTVDFEEYNGKSPEAIVENVVKITQNYDNYKFVNMWMKNIQPEDRIIGNDLPDVEIVKRVMSEKLVEEDSDKKAS